jgi:hypothetical protein
MRQAAPQHMTGSVIDSVVDDDARTRNREVIEGSWEGLKKPGYVETVERRHHVGQSRLICQI